MVINCLPLFPFAKITLLASLYFLTGDRSIFQFSISFISISFLIRFASGNPFSITKKFLHNAGAIGGYRVICVGISALSLVAFFSISPSLPNPRLALLLVSLKLLEAALSSILFEMTTTKDAQLPRMGIYLGGLSIIFICVTALHGLVLAILLDALLMSLAVMSLRRYLVRIKHALRFTKILLVNNVEITATVLPVSLFILWYNNFEGQTQSNSDLLGYLALAFSTAGFIGRPASLWASRLGAMRHKALSSTSHYISVFAFFLAAVQLEYPLPYFGIIFAGLFSACVVIQNFIRINLYSNQSLSLLRVHILETLLILVSILAGASVLQTAMVLLLTRTARLMYMSLHKDSSESTATVPPKNGHMP